MSRRLIAALRKLRQAPEGRLASSQLSDGQRRELTSFAQATSSVLIRPQGRGVVFEISLPAVVEHQWRQLDRLTKPVHEVVPQKATKGITG